MQIVFKIGSNVLLDDGNQLSLEFIKKLVSQVNLLRQAGHQVTIISSGAVAVGQLYLNKKNILRSAQAALGQTELMKYYVQFFNDRNIKIAQILLSPNAFKNRERYDRLKQTLENLVSNKIIPIINENDATVLEDTFGENDSLAGIMAVTIGANRLIYLTNVDGLYSNDPQTDKKAKLIKEVSSVNLEKQKLCSQKTSSLGRGGMLSKLKGAKLASTCGIEVFIVNGLKPENISKLMAGVSVGTKFIPQKGKISERKKWLLIGSVSQGKIIIDKGARTALENNKSLLAVGVRGVAGIFNAGDFVNISDQEGEIFAFGLVNYNSKILTPLNSLKDKNKIKENYKKEIVHIDNLTILK
ncbi:MAG: glutamate 5-kinase [Patescibacteria group bacterium]